VSVGDCAVSGEGLHSRSCSEFMGSDMIGQMEASSESTVESCFDAFLLQPTLVTVATQTDDYDNDDEDDAYYIDLQSCATVPGIYEEP